MRYCIGLKLAKGKKELNLRKLEVAHKRKKIIIIIMITAHKNLPNACVKRNHTKIE